MSAPDFPRLAKEVDDMDTDFLINEKLAFDQIFI